MDAQTEILENPSALARRVAEWMTDTAVASTGPFRVSLSGGSTPNLLYGLLATAPFCNHFPWERVLWFWGDERFVPLEHRDSNYRMTNEQLLSRFRCRWIISFRFPLTARPQKPPGSTSRPCSRFMARSSWIRNGRSLTSRSSGSDPTATPRRSCRVNLCSTNAFAGWRQSRRDDRKCGLR